MKAIITMLMLFAGLSSFSQNFELFLNEPDKDITLPLYGYSTDRDTVVVFNTMNQPVSYFNLEELRDRLVINLKNSRANAVGDYSIVVMESKSRLKIREYPLQVRTPKPVIKNVYAKDMGKWFLFDVFELRWENNSDFLTLVIEGRNFYPEDLNNNMQGRIIDWVGSDPNIAFDIVEQNDSLLVLKLNLSRLTRSGKYDLRVVNFDDQQSESTTVSFVPQYPSVFANPSSTWDLPVNVEKRVRLNCTYAYEVKRLFFADASGNEITDGSYIKCRAAGNNQVDLTIRYVNNFYAIYYTLWHDEKPAMLFPAGSSVFRPVADNSVSFGIVERYDTQTINAGEEFPLNKTPNVDGGAIQLTSENGRNTLTFEYMVKDRGSNEKHYLRVPSEIKLSAGMNGKYSASYKGVDVTGEIRINEVPRLESIRWINSDEEMAKFMKGNVYATGTAQKYLLQMNFEFNYKPAENDFSVFGVPLINPVGGGKRYTYEVTLPATLAPGDRPEITYMGKCPVIIKNSQGNEAVLSYNRPAEIPGFITIVPDERDAAKYDFYDNLGETRTLSLKPGKTKLKIKVHNYKEYHMGNQNLTITCTLRTLHGATKVSNSDKQVNNDAIQEKTIALAEGDSIEFSVGFNTLKITSWNMVDISVTFNRNAYSFPYIQNDQGKVFTILYRNDNKIKFTYGLSIPTTAMAVHDFSKKEWIWSPYTAGLDFGFDWVDENGASKGHGVGVELGFFQFVNLFDNATESFSFSITPFYKRIFGYKKQADILVPLSVGAGAVPEWRNGVNYWNLAVMFQIKFDGLANRVSR